jgi:hypothetical protein
MNGCAVELGEFDKESRRVGVNVDVECLAWEKADHF